MSGRVGTPADGLAACEREREEWRRQAEKSARQCLRLRAQLAAAERSAEELAAEVERLKAKLTPTRTVRREVDLCDDEETP